MTARKKLILLISVLSITFVLAITATIVVLVASNRKAQSNVAVKFTAIDVVGEMSASYYIANGEETSMTGSNNEQKITFDATNTSGTLAPDKHLALTAENSNVVFEYKFNNTSNTIPMNVKLTHIPSSLIDDEKFENVKVSYLVCSEHVDNLYYESLEFEEASLLGVSIIVPTNTVKYVYLKVEVDSFGKNANFAGNIAWTLQKASTNASSQIVIKDQSNANITNISTNNRASVSKVVNVYLNEGMNSSNLTATASAKGGEEIIITKGNLVQVGNAGYVPFTITRPSNISNALNTMVSFKYNDGVHYPETSFLNINFTNIVSFELELDNEDDKYYGLEQKRVFGTWKLAAASTKDNNIKDFTMQLNYTLDNNNSSQKMYWTTSDENVATIDNNGLLTFKSFINFDGQKELAFVVYAHENETWEESEIRDLYNFTLVDGCNIYSTSDFEKTRANMLSIVLQTSLGCSDADRVEDRPYVTDFTLVKDGVFDIINAQIYGNGYVINFSNVPAGDGFCFDRHANTTTLNLLTNLVVRGTSKDISVSERNTKYTIFENTTRVSVTASSSANSVFEQCIFRDITEYGVLIGSENNGNVIFTNNIFYNTGMVGIFFDDAGKEASKLYIQGYFDVYNFKQKSEFESTYQTAIQSFIENNPNLVHNGKINSLIFRGEFSFSSLDSMANDLYINNVAIARKTNTTLRNGWTLYMAYETYSLLGSAELVTIYPKGNNSGINGEIDSTSIPDYTKVQRLGTNTLSVYN